jgi:hypothetical protein
MEFLFADSLGIELNLIALRPDTQPFLIHFYQYRGIRNVEIVSFNRNSRHVVISHRDKSFNELLKMINIDRAKGEKREV